MSRKPGRMANLGKKIFDKTNSELSDDEANILLTTTVNWDDLKLEITDAEIYDKLITIVNESTQKNENLAQLKSRLKTLGEKGTSVAKQIIKLIT